MILFERKEVTRSLKYYIFYNNFVPRLKDL